MSLMTMRIPLKMASVLIISLLANDVSVANENNGQFTAGAEELVGLLTGTAEKRKRTVSERNRQNSQAQNSQGSESVIPGNELEQLLALPIEQQQKLIKEKLKSSENPIGLIQALVSEGILDLSPAEVQFIRNMTELRLEAENRPLQAPEVQSGAVNFDSRDRYKIYEFNVHDSGVTVLEFYDANGKRWPIAHHTPVKNFVVEKGFQNNTLNIQSEIPYKVAYSHVHLEGFTNPISIKINYNTELRDGIRTFRIPFIYKTETSSNQPQIDYTPLSAVKASDAVGQGGSKIPDLEYQDLMYLASVGHFDENSKSSEYANTVLVDRPEVVSIWKYGSKFVLRSRFQLISHQYQVYVPSPDGVAVYVTDQLDTLISLNVNGRNQDVLLPDYHLY